MTPSSIPNTAASLDDFQTTCLQQGPYDPMSSYKSGLQNAICITPETTRTALAQRPTPSQVPFSLPQHGRHGSFANAGFRQPHSYQRGGEPALFDRSRTSVTFPTTGSLIINSSFGQPAFPTPPFVPRSSRPEYTPVPPAGQYHPLWSLLRTHYCHHAESSCAFSSHVPGCKCLDRKCLARDHSFSPRYHLR